MRMPDGNEVRTRVLRCSQACPAEAATVTLHEKTRNNGSERAEAPVISFADRAGHVLRTVQYSLEGRLVATDERYDQQGRAQFRYWPRFVGAEEAWGSATGSPLGGQLRQELIYDVLGRIIQIDQLDEMGTRQHSRTDYCSGQVISDTTIGARSGIFRS